MVYFSPNTVSPEADHTSAIAAIAVPRISIHPSNEVPGPRDIVPYRREYVPLPFSLVALILA
jgi:hypothetical protein